MYLYHSMTMTTDVAMYRRSSGAIALRDRCHTRTISLMYIYAYIFVYLINDCFNSTARQSPVNFSYKYIFFCLDSIAPAEDTLYGCYTNSHVM